MVRIDEVTNALSKLIGWSTELGYEQTDLVLDESLTKSESGLYFQQVHPLLTLKTLLAIAPEHISSMQAGDAKNKAFSAWLAAKTKASISKAIQQFCNNKVVNITGKGLIENKVLFDGTSRIVDTIKNTGSMVGFEIIPIRSRGITLKINKIGLFFTEPGDYTLYLMKSGCLEPVKTIQVTKTKRNTVEWFDQEDLFLSYLPSEGEAGGSWYLVYSQTEIPLMSKAINKEYDWSKGPCSYCSRREMELYKAWSRYLEIHPFKSSLDEPMDFNTDFNNDFRSGVLLWNAASNLYTYTTNYGINLEVSVMCDLTDFIIEQRNLFRDIIWYQVGCDMLRELAYNPNVRVNRTVLNASRAEILYELDGDSRSTKKSGLVYSLDKAYKAVDLDTRGIDRVCLPCKGSGIKYRSAVL